jgi:hypothetical protein
MIVASPFLPANEQAFIRRAAAGWTKPVGLNRWVQCDGVWNLNRVRGALRKQEGTGSTLYLLAILEAKIPSLSKLAASWLIA